MSEEFMDRLSALYHHQQTRKPKASPECPVKAEAVIAILREHPDSTDAALATLGGWAENIVHNLLFTQRGIGTVVKNFNTDTYRVYEPPQGNSYRQATDEAVSVTERRAQPGPEVSAATPVPVEAQISDHKPSPQSEVQEIVAKPLGIKWPSDADLVRRVDDLKAAKEPFAEIIAKEFGCAPGTVIQRANQARSRLKSAAEKARWQADGAQSELRPTRPDETTVAPPVIAAEPTPHSPMHTPPTATEAPILILMSLEGTGQHELAPAEYLPELGDQWPQVSETDGKMRVRVWYCWDAVTLDCGRQMRLMVPPSGMVLKPEEAIA